VYLSPESSLTDESLDDLKNSVQQAQNDGSVNLVIDFKQVRFISSQNLEFLSDLALELRQSSGSLRLADVNTICSDILTMTKLDQNIPVFEDIESAGRSFL